MTKFRFTAQHFNSIGVLTDFTGFGLEAYLQRIADIANALLEAEEKRCTRVYAVKELHGWQNQTSLDYQLASHTKIRSALLWGVEEYPTD